MLDLHESLTVPAHHAIQSCISIALERLSMSVAGIATSAVAVNQAQTAQSMTNAMIKQQHASEEAIVKLLDQAVDKSSNLVEAGRVDITV